MKDMLELLFGMASVTSLQLPDIEDEIWPLASEASVIQLGHLLP